MSDMAGEAAMVAGEMSGSERATIRANDLETKVMKFFSLFAFIRVIRG